MKVMLIMFRFCRSYMFWMGDEGMEEVKEFKNLGKVLCKHGNMIGKIRERTAWVRQVIGHLGEIHIMEDRSVNLTVLDI